MPLRDLCAALSRDISLSRGPVSAPFLPRFCHLKERADISRAGAIIAATVPDGRGRFDRPY